MVYHNLTDLIGRTPLLELHNIESALGLKAKIIAKLECRNPGGSIKDRAALAMITDAETKGLLKKGGTIIEPTSGNTGIGLAWVASVRGYHLILTMPETMSLERRKLLSALGAKLVLTPGNEGMSGAIKEAERLRVTTPGAVILQQFDNPANPRAHELTTSEEIWEDTNGDIDILVATVGTGGTLSGTAAGLKRHKPSLKAVAVEPAASPVLSDGKPGKHRIQGIGAGFVPKNFNRDVADEILQVTDEAAMAASRLLAQKEGLLAGFSGGAALDAAIAEAKKAENAGKTIVCILPDSGERYLSTDLFNEK